MGLGTTPIERMDAARERMIRDAAQYLWLDAYWDEERMSAFDDVQGKSPIAAYGQQMEGWPTPPIPAAVITATREMIVGTEAAWKRSIEDVAAEMGHDVDWLAYRLVMATIGHGVGPDDDGDFPDDLDSSPLYRENPGYMHTPEVGDWTGTDIVA